MPKIMLCFSAVRKACRRARSKPLQKELLGSSNRAYQRLSACFEKSRRARCFWACAPENRFVGFSRSSAPTPLSQLRNTAPATSLPQLRFPSIPQKSFKTTQFRSQFAFAVWVPLPQLCSHSAFAAAVDALQVPQHDRIIPTANRQRPVELGEADRSKPNLTSTKYRPAFQSFARAPPALEMCGGAPPPRRAAADAPGAARPPSAVWRAGRSVGSRLGAGHRPRRAGVSGTSRPHCSCPNALQSFPARAASTAPPPPAPNPPPHWGGARGEAE